MVCLPDDMLDRRRKLDKGPGGRSGAVGLVASYIIIIVHKRINYNLWVQGYRADLDDTLWLYNLYSQVSVVSRRSKYTLSIPRESGSLTGRFRDIVTSTVDR